MAAITTSNCSSAAGSPLMMLLFKAIAGEESEDEARRRREQLNRRPSYRMILKDLETADKVMKKEPEETPPSSVDASPLQVNIPSVILQPPSSQQLQPQHQQSQQPPPPSSLISAVTSSSGASPYGSPINASILGSNPSSLVHPFHHLNGDLPLQATTIEFAAAIAAAAQQKPTTIANSNHSLGPVQNGIGVVAGPSSGIQAMAQQQQQQHQNPMNPGPSSQPGHSGVEGPSSANLAHAMKPIVGIDPTNFSDWQSPLLSGYSSSPSPTMQSNIRMSGGPMHGGEEETNRKRQVRLLKNREAAKECRRKKKEYVKCLENRVSVLENQNKALIEELKTLKELYCRKEKSEM